MLNGKTMGTQIANAIISPKATPAARAVLLANWIKIANIICMQIQATAQVTVPVSPVATSAGPGTCSPLPGKVV